MVGSPVHSTQPPNGSFCGTPSSSTSARLAPEPAIERTLIPWVVGFEAWLEVRLNSCTPGVAVSASSRRGAVAIASLPMVTMENALSVGDGGNRAASTTTVSTSGGRSRGTVATLPNYADGTSAGFATSG